MIVLKIEILTHIVFLLENGGFRDEVIICDLWTASARLKESSHYIEKESSSLVDILWNLLRVLDSGSEKGHLCTMFVYVNQVNRDGIPEVQAVGGICAEGCC